MPDIFLSYTREDQATAQRFAEAFEAQGFAVWWDVTLRSGEAYDQVTEEALWTAKAVVVLWSKKSVASRWVRAEATVADQNKTLAPVTIEACRRPVMFELTQTADLSHWDGDTGDKAWQAYLADVRRMVEHGGQTKLEAPAPLATTAPATSTGSGMPVTAVLPIGYRAGDEQMEILAEDLTEDITRELGQSPYCKVIAASTMAAWRGAPIDHRTLRRELEARYLVEGKLQRTGDAIRLTVQLVDSVSDSMLWSSRFVRALSEVDLAPEEFLLSVVAELSQAIGQLEVNRALAKRGPCSPWEHVMRSLAISARQAPGNARRALEEARSAVSAAPDYGLACATLASALAGRLGWDRLALSRDDVSAIVGETHDLIKRATELDGNNPVVLCQLVNVYGSLGNGEAALALALRATKLAPNSAEAQYALGFAYFILGRTGDAIAALRTQDRLALSDISRMTGLAILGICLFIEGRSAEAEEAIDRSLALEPNNYLTLRWKAIIAAEQGKEESARAAVKLLRKSEPGKSTEDYLDSPKHLPVEHERKYEAIAILRRLLEETEEGA
jgi:TolB-like protein/cytochrome c-type biogenesis protein CcmH/NrfG